MHHRTGKRCYRRVHIPSGQPHSSRTWVSTSTACPSALNPQSKARQIRFPSLAPLSFLERQRANTLCQIGHRQVALSSETLSSLYGSRRHTSMPCRTRHTQVESHRHKVCTAGHYSRKAVRPRRTKMSRTAQPLRQEPLLNDASSLTFEQSWVLLWSSG